MNTGQRRICLLFPGQGSQFAGMGKNLLEFPEAAAIFESADRLTAEFPVSRFCFEGPEETLRQTRRAQPAIFTVSAACFETFKKRGNVRVEFAAGHSVGEYAALAAAGVLSFQDAFRLVRRRGELMYQAGLSRPGKMTAILGMSPQDVEAVCREASSQTGTVEIANLNTPSQTVVSGDPEAVDKAGDLAKQRGAKRVIPLPVSGAFHSALMEEAAGLLADELDKAVFREARFPVVSNVTGKPVTDGETIRSLLKGQIRKKVRWEDSVRYVLNSGVKTFVEMEPGSVLSGLVRSIDKSAEFLKLDALSRV